MYPFFVCALGDFLVLFVPILRQIARYLPPHRTKNDSKTHPRSSHDKFKTASNFVDKEIIMNQNILRVSKPTASRILQQMNDWLEMQGKVGKGTYYIPKWLTNVSQTK